MCLHHTLSPLFHIPDITLSPYIWIELAQSNIHCYHARVMAWDWKSRIKWCSSCTAAAKWKRLPYFCPGGYSSAVVWQSIASWTLPNPSLSPLLLVQGALARHLLTLTQTIQTARWHRLFCQAGVFFNNLPDHTAWDVRLHREDATALACAFQPWPQMEIMMQWTVRGWSYLASTYLSTCLKSSLVF